MPHHSSADVESTIHEYVVDRKVKLPHRRPDRPVTDPAGGVGRMPAPQDASEAPADSPYQPIGQLGVAAVGKRGDSGSE